MSDAEYQYAGRSYRNFTARQNGERLLLDEEGNVIFQTFVFSTIPDSELDVFHEVGAGEAGRLDLIAYKYYSNPRLDWVILFANPFVKNPIRDITPGLVLRVPSVEYVYQELIR